MWERVIIVSPTDTGIRQARAKTDRLDARTIAKLLASGSLEGLWMPDQPTQALRRRLQRRRQLVAGRTRAKNEIHAALMRRLIAKPKVSDLFGLEGRRWLEELELPAEERETVDSCLRQIDFLDSELARADRVIAADALRSAEIRRLMSVPGVNVVTAATLMAAIGEIGRFGSPRRLVGSSASTRGFASPARPGRLRADLKAGLPVGPLRAGRGSLVGGPAAGAAACLLSADPGPPRPPGRDRRGRAQARLPVLVPAHPRGGLRLRAAIAHAQEAVAT